MERYTKLSEKLHNNTITEVEKHELFIMAFGSTYLRSVDKSKLREYQQQ